VLSIHPSTRTSRWHSLAKIKSPVFITLKIYLDEYPLSTTVFCSSFGNAFILVAPPSSAFLFRLTKDDSVFSWIISNLIFMFH
jgi:hypothetical protein